MVCIERSWVTKWQTVQSLTVGTPPEWQIMHDARLSPATIVVALECSPARPAALWWQNDPKQPMLSGSGACDDSMEACLTA